MTLDEIFKAITVVFQDCFEEDDLVLSVDLTAEDVEGWTSLSHIRMILAVEEEFAVRFSASEVSSLTNVGDLVNLIKAKT